MKKIHIAGGAVSIFAGVYHTICWLFILGFHLLSHLTIGLIIAIPTGVILLLAGVKLIWPPGMTGMADTDFCKCFKFMKSLDNFLKDSKYGSWHVYLANIFFFNFCLHASVALFPSNTWYWTFTLFCFFILFILHPTRATYFAASYFEPFEPIDSFKRKYITLSKSVVSIRQGTLSDVKLRLRMPTYDSQFDEAYPEKKPYTGYCDVILIKYRNPEHKWISEFEAVHYYSVVNVSTVTDSVGGDEIEAQLMIQKTSRPGGCSAALMDTKDVTGDKIEVSELYIICFLVNYIY
jgi:hypothetical protein